MSAPQAQDKLAFLLSLVPYLLERGPVSVSEAAEHFSTSPEAVRSAVELIAVSGVPGETRAYLPNDLFDIDWDALEQHDEIALVHQVAIDDSPRFSAREAAALIAGLQYLSGLPENADRESIGVLMAKLAHGASAAPSELAVAEGATDAALATIRGAVDLERCIEFDYLNARGEHERRRVDPLRIESAERDWYLRGWCHLRKAVRTFRLDRMSDIAVTDDPIGRHDDLTLPDTLFQPSSDDLEVVLDVATSALPLLADYRPRVTTPKGSARSRATLRVAHHHSLKRLVAGLPGIVTVLGPAEARRVVAEWAGAGVARYAEPEGEPPSAAHGRER